MSDINSYCHSAHFIIELRNDGPFPQFIGCGIFSSPAQHLTSRPSTIFAEVLSVEGYKSYQEASDRLKQIILDMPRFAWAKPFIGGGRDNNMDACTIHSFLMRGM